LIAALSRSKSVTRSPRERLDEDVQRAAARQAVFDGGFVADAVRHELRLARADRGLRLFEEFGFHAAAADRARDLAALVDRERRSGVARCRALDADEGRDRDALPFGPPPVDRFDDV
jgi:hypothetical protein